jgi:hypothetical protein
LLRAENPRADLHAPADLRKHLKRCPTCASLAVDLQRLEQAWRALPLPPEAHTARDAFLKRLPLGAGTGKVPLSFFRRLGPLGWATAATVLLAITGVTTWLLLIANSGQGTPEAVNRPAAPDVVDRLLDWNLSLAQATTLEERKRILLSKEAELRAVLAAAVLSPEDREFSEELLANGAWLAAHDDPVSEADRFTAVADRLQERMKWAAGHGKEHEWNRCAQHFRLVTEKGVAATMERVRKMGEFNEEQKRRLNGMQQRDDRREHEFERMLERAPKGLRPTIQQSLEFFRKMPRFKGGKGR